jgi:hypothetical protein
MLRPLWLAALVLTALWGAALGRPRYADDGPPSPVVYPEQRIPLVFTHAAHLERGLGCVDCHERAPTSRSAVDNLLPGEAACRPCHPIDRADPTKQVDGPPARCDACHVGYVVGEPPARVHLPPPNLKFDHAAHVARGMACSGCHGDLAAEGIALATRDQLPRMRLCLTCHDGTRAPDACTTCHLAEVGRLRTTWPEGNLAPAGVIHGDAHDLDFVRRHGAVATGREAYCGACHRPSFCADCHTGVTKPMDFHPGDYATTHAPDARRNDPDCSVCHRQQSFCVGCHERAGVGQRAGGAFAQEVAARRFHPADWVSFVGGGNRHAREARANLGACASCHREDSCLACHSAELGGPRVSPHGPRWRGSARCEALAQKNGRMCLRCHITAAVPSCDGP